MVFILHIKDLSEQLAAQHFWTPGIRQKTLGTESQSKCRLPRSHFWSFTQFKHIENTKSYPIRDNKQLDAKRAPEIWYNSLLDVGDLM